MTALSALLLGAVATGCEASFPHSAAPTTSLRVHGTPPDAVVTIDEELVGPLAVVAVRGVALREGTHQVTVSAPGFFPWDRLVTAAGREKPIALEVNLVPIPQ